MTGNAISVMERLDPINADKTPKMNVPTNAPQLDIELIHDNCTLVIGPVVSGVSVDRSIGSAGESHPTIHP